MATPQVINHNPDLSLAIVQPSTITQFEKTAPEFQQLYDRLFNENQELALWLRQRAEQLYDDLDDRETAAALALEALAILGNQVAINGLYELLQLSMLGQ